MDIILAVIGFFLLYYWNGYLSDFMVWIVFGVMLAVWLVLELGGYWAYKVLNK